MSFLLQFQLPLLSLHKLIQLPSGPGTLSPTPPYEFPLPLGGYRASVWPVTKVPKLPTGLGLEYALKRIFECFSGLFCVRLCLACQDLVGHVGHYLFSMHGFFFPQKLRKGYRVASPWPSSTALHHPSPP